MSLFTARRPSGGISGVGSVPFEAELYLHAPERFGRWHDGQPNTPAIPPVLTEEQLRGEFALAFLRWTCLVSLAVTLIGLLVILWRLGLA
ncbi:hypothetical protein ACE7GA_25265 [Roseomonas sp. CCTCC AB2023176]|uniref:hypothetical protein n=1 Tax=Roseomonas sp. CCTCC AB2023176 TaxID=3342640 RepID=UPI0035DCCAF7